MSLGPGAVALVDVVCRELEARAAQQMLHLVIQDSNVRNEFHLALVRLIAAELKKTHG